MNPEPFKTTTETVDPLSKNELRVLKKLFPEPVVELESAENTISNLLEQEKTDLEEDLKLFLKEYDDVVLDITGNQNPEETHKGLLEKKVFLDHLLRASEEANNTFKNKKPDKHERKSKEYKDLVNIYKQPTSSAGNYRQLAAKFLQLSELQEKFNKLQKRTKSQDTPKEEHRNGEYGKTITRFREFFKISNLFANDIENLEHKEKKLQDSVNTLSEGLELISNHKKIIAQRRKKETNASLTPEEMKTLAGMPQAFKNIKEYLPKKENRTLPQDIQKTINKIPMLSAIPPNASTLWSEILSVAERVALFAHTPKKKAYDDSRSPTSTSQDFSATKKQETNTAGHSRKATNKNQTIYP